ncbi:hypothetical protein WH50_16520 [Pokkaliibacter plantistimulans]|uniref:tRNA pseudouridine synthase B n=1 Tax=Pokkaliibacter plantistimulans TaxID=1635171 RepID=A0ABX5LZP6_9GAMM|nr:tRNA pseudouridine(55) synthase TruB [Pokkaliibacter plantistimulans]PXF30150.1 hypothetical protein WH50_16520 [Pokkaliibacter plantistimulans]
MSQKKSSNYWREVSGILVLDKPQGLTSNSALQKVRHLLRAAKAGHTGALDPLATGVLPLCFGEATKFSQLLLDADKGYVTVARLGTTTDTADAEGQVLLQRPLPALTAELIESVLCRFRGEIEQLPPLYSALKVDGQPLYKLAREGRSIDMETKRRQVTISSLRLLNWSESTLELEVKCSKGTYIRSLVADIGEALGCGAHVEVLRRTLAGPFTLANAMTLEQLQQTAQPEEIDNPLLHHLMLAETAVMHLNTVELDPLQTERLRQGQRIALTDVQADPLLRIYANTGEFLGLGEVVASGMLHPRRLLKTS